jgi:hypothetical protein
VYNVQKRQEHRTNAFTGHGFYSFAWPAICCGLSSSFDSQPLFDFPSPLLVFQCIALMDKL